VTGAPPARQTLRGTGFWLLWLNAVSLSLIVSADRFTFTWLVDDTLDGPKWASGVVIFALGLPVCLLVLTAGALADRVDRGRMLLVTQGAGMVVVSVAAVLVWTDVITLLLATVVAVAFGVVVAFAMPVRSSLLPALVGKERLMQGVVLMTIGMNVSMIAGPLAVGGVIKAHGVGWAFALQAACFALGFIAAARIDAPAHPVVEQRPRLRTDILEGLHFVWGHAVLRPLFALLAVGGGLMAGAAFTLLPKIAREHFGRDAAEAARLFALMGLGMVITSLMLMRYRSRIRYRGLVFMVAMVFGTANQVVQGIAPSFLLLEVLLLFWGLSGGFYLNLNQALIQEFAPLDRMGRVMALSSLLNAGLMPIGALFAGFLAAVTGPRTALSVFGALGLACVLSTLWRSQSLRRIA
jgi:MFS family permease